MRRCMNCMSEYPEECLDTCPHCGYVDGKTQDGTVYLMPGSILQGRYIVGTVATARDVDVIYHGWDALFDRRVQIQEYFPRYCATRSGKSEVSIYDSKQERYEEGLKLFFRQCRELIRLYQESGIVTCHACFQENRTAYAILDDRSDKTLEEALNGRTMKAREALSLLWEVIGSVDKCHRIGIYHGLISARTFWLARDGRPVLKDFGAWRYCSGEPGIVDYGKAGPQTDVYRIAQLFCRLVVGKEIQDEEKLEAELLKRQISLNGTVLAAVKNALSHETKSLAQFREELYGKGGRRSRSAGSSKRRQDKYARDSLTLPRWAVGGAAAVMAAIAVFTVLVATGAVKMRIQSEESHLGRQVVRVPNVVKMDVDEAQKELKAMRLVLTKDRMEYSNEVEQNRITYQSPKEGSTVKEGESVTVHISLGKEKALLPPVQGVAEEEAKAKLREAGFYHINTVEDDKTDGAYGAVLEIELRGEQEAEEGSGKKEDKNLLSKIFNNGKEKSPDKKEEPIPLDTEITLVICKKKEEAVLAKANLLVPSVTGMEKNEAQAALEKMGFRINWVEEASPEPAGTILGQAPKTGEMAASGSYVTIRVSKGSEKILMENVMLLTEEEARAKIEALGLETGEVKKDYSDSEPAGKVISQSIAQNEKVEKGDKVNLVVSLGRRPEESVKAPETKPAKAAEPKRKPTEPAKKQETEDAAKRQQEAEEESRRQSEEAEKVKQKAAQQAAAVVEEAKENMKDTAKNTPETDSVFQGPTGTSGKEEKPSEPAGVIQAGPPEETGKKTTVPASSEASPAAETPEVPPLNLQE